MMALRNSFIQQHKREGIVKKKLMRAAVAAFVTALVFNSGANAGELRIGTASQGGAFYPIGQAISNLVTKYVDGTTMVPIVTQGSVQNPRLVANGEVDLGITNNNLAWFAINGTGPYKDGELPLAGVAALHPSVLHMVALEGSDIHDVGDLRGKRVAVGPAGGGTVNILTNLLAAYDMSIDDITPSFLSYGDGFSELGDGNVDAALALAGYPTSAVLQTQATKNIQFIGIAGDKLADVLASHSYYTSIDVPADTYKTSSPTTMIGVNNMLVVRSDMDADKVNAIASAIFDHMDEFVAENAIAKQIDPARSKTLAIALHPGAQSYFDGK